MTTVKIGFPLSLVYPRKGRVVPSTELVAGQRGGINIRRREE